MNSLALANLGMPELIVILVVVLVIFGPKSLPKLARALGQSIREFKDATNKMTDQLMKEDEPQPPAARRPPAVEAAPSQPVSTTAARDAERPGPGA